MATKTEADIKIGKSIIACDESNKPLFTLTEILERVEDNVSYVVNIDKSGKILISGDIIKIYDEDKNTHICNIKVLRNL